MKLDPTQRLLFDYEITLDAWNRLHGEKKKTGKTVAEQVREEYRGYIG